MKNLLQRKNENRNSKETTKEPRKEFQQVGVDNRKTETNRNDELLHLMKKGKFGKLEKT